MSLINDNALRFLDPRTPTILSRMSRGAKNVNERSTAFFLRDILRVPGYSFKPVSTQELNRNRVRKFVTEDSFRLRNGMTLAPVVCNTLKVRLPMVRHLSAPSAFRSTFSNFRALRWVWRFGEDSSKQYQGSNDLGERIRCVRVFLALH